MTSSLASRRTEGVDFSLLAHRTAAPSVDAPLLVVAPDLSSDSAPPVSTSH
jgi:hypothetical protein